MSVDDAGRDPGREAGRRDRTFLARYGATILRGGIAAVPAALFRYQGELELTPQQAWFIAAILAHKWDADMPYPSLKRLAEQTGVSRQKLHDYQRQLVEADLLVVVNRYTAAGGQDTNCFDFSPLFHRLEECLERDRPSLPSASGTDRGPAGGPGAGRGVDRGLQTPADGDLQAPVNPRRHPPVQTGLHEKEPREETLEIDPSNNRRGRDRASTGTAPGSEEGIDEPGVASSRRLGESPVVGAGARADTATDGPAPNRAGEQERETVEWYVEDLARELGDRAPLKSSGTRALNLYRRSGLAMAEFAARLQQARGITKQRLAQVRGERRPGRPKAAMSYFFAVLEDVLGLRA